MKYQHLAVRFVRPIITCLITATITACGGGAGNGIGNDYAKNVDRSKTTTTATTALKITTTSCHGGTQGTAYVGCTIAATGGTPPYKFSVSSTGKFPPLPEGMAINSTTGVISSANIGGQGFYGTQFVVTDSSNATETQIVNFAISGSNKFLSTIFPSNSIFHHRVDAASTGLPVDTSPAAAFNTTWLTGTIKHFFGNQFSYPWPYGTPAIQVPATQAVVSVTTSPYNAYFTSAPIAANTPVEGTMYSTEDRHVVVYVEAGTSTAAALYEMYQGAYTNTNNSGSWSDSGNAMWTNVATATPLLPKGGTVAAGIPNGPLLINADEVLGTGTSAAPNGTIKHTLRMTVPKMLDNWVWPATTTAGTGSCAGVATYSALSQITPPTSCTAGSPAGEIYRLKAGTVMPACVATSPQTAIIVTALQNYGMIVSDNGTVGQLVGTPDARWNDSDLNCLNSLTLAEFEPVNVSSLMISVDDGATSH